MVWHEPEEGGYATAMSTPQPIVPTGDEPNSPTHPDSQSEEWIDGAQDQDADADGPISADNQPDSQRENTDQLPG